ncbi:hypothetical protein PPL_01980 [Heterostelium album PN500]|uniref:Uncharacterized protein n=1 Tax=Heterostelium pallidum (strain ATCC 26659 / Pp 5 / PN500) TaxID=670386 RepID=D3B112_HETP5|nr:hypothetical protein PPL_01980 [Heterostelium album PN500]EFA84986.1 hypothetical protein PPL_01980 [Heterostelium album PN500]|eukprot:XP_020437096.1 hypothetical protein PPL_01980 [Heterostelium album PN500]
MFLESKIIMFGYTLDGDSRQTSLDFFSYKKLCDIVYNDKLLEMIEYYNNKRNTISHTSKILNINNSTIVLPDILLDKIVTYAIPFDRDFSGGAFSIRMKMFAKHSHHLIDAVNLLNYALVSKKLFQYVSKFIKSNSHFSWNGYLNFNSEFSLVRSEPSFFNYESIKYIPYDHGVDYANRLMSRVDTFAIVSDEIDYSVKGMVSRDSMFDDKDLYDYETFEEEYRDAIISQGYLVYPPAMPNLKDIFVLNYYGYSSNYSDLLSNIFSQTPNGDGHGIERFYIKIVKDWKSSPRFSNLGFLGPLLKFHSKTLKSIRIRYRDMKAFDVGEILKVFIQIHPFLVENNRIDFKLITNTQISETLPSNNIFANYLISYLEVKNK